MPGFTTGEQRLLKRLRTPSAVQDYLDTLRVNFEARGPTCYSPKTVMSTGEAHCVEGAVFAACALQGQGHQPLLLDLRAIDPDFDHVVAVFQIQGRLGAISKTNHAVLRYREPIYRTIRELALSFFHEYFLDNGQKTLRDYSVLLNLNRFTSRQLQTSDQDIWYVPEALDEIRHFPFLLPGQSRNLRRASKIEIAAGKLVEWRESGRRAVRNTNL